MATPARGFCGPSPTRPTAEAGTLSEGELIIFDEIAGNTELYLGSGVNPNVEVQISGVVRPFNLPAFESDLQHDFPDDRLAAYAGRNAIVADQILLIDDGQSGSSNGG